MFSSLKSPQSLSPSQAQWSGIQRPLVHWNWVLEQDWMQPASSLPSPQSSSTKHSQKGVTTPTHQHLMNSILIHIRQRLSFSPESQCHFTLMHRPLEQLNCVRSSQVGNAEKHTDTSNTVQYQCTRHCYPI